jgi:alpha-tubulin suppressor-like RCC1 family protein
VTAPAQTLAVEFGRTGGGAPAGLSNSVAIAAGGFFDLALQSNNTIVAWGDNSRGQTDVPAGISNAVAIAAGQYHGLALLASGGIRSWGSYSDGVNFYSVTDYPGLAGPPTSNVMAMAAGMGHDLAVLSNGNLVVWGLTNLYVTTSNALAFQSNLTGVQAVACGWNHNLTLLSNGQIRVWGLNGSALGWNLTNAPPGLSNVAAISAYGLVSMVLLSNGTVKAWGYSPDGETNVPEGLSNVVAIAAGGLQCLALQQSGTVVAWGQSALTNVPAGLAAAKNLSAGFEHSLVLQSGLRTPIILEEPTDQYAPAGSNVTFLAQAESLAPVAYQWQFNGTNRTDATGAGLTLTNVQAGNEGSYQVIISAGDASINSAMATFTLVTAPEISASATAPTNWWINTPLTLNAGVSAIDPAQYPIGYQWTLNGTNVSTAPGNYTVFPTPAAEGTYTLVVTNVAGSNSVSWDIRVALPGMAQAWGDNSHQECNRPATLSNVSGIAAGEYHSVAVTDSGNIVQWGEYSDGTNFSAVGSPPAGSNFVAVAAGLGHDLALTASGAVTNWGLASNVANFVPANLPAVAAITAGWFHNAAILTNKTAVAWGDNTYGQLNIPSDLTNGSATVTAITAGDYFTVALRSDGHLEAWGDNSCGQTTIPATASNNIVAVAAGGKHCLALTASGQVIAWGLNTSAQCNVPTNLSNVMAVAAGEAHSVALVNDGTLVEWGNNTNLQATVPSQLPTTVITTNTTPSVTNITSITNITSSTTNITTTTNIVPAATNYQTNFYPPIVVKLIAAGGNHTMAALWSPLVQYPIDVSKDLLLIYNTNSTASSNVWQYYLHNRPMVSNANCLGIGCSTDEQVIYEEYSTNISPQIQNWLTANPTKRPLYVLLFPDIPSRPDLDYGTSSLQCLIHFNYAANWQPFISSINMNGLGGTSDCIAYINKLTNMAGTNQTLFLSALKAGYANTNWYFDNTAADLNSGLFYYQAELSVLNVNESASITYTNVTSGNARGTLAGHITNAINLAGFGSWGVHGYWWAPGSNGYYGPTNSGYVTNGTIQFSGKSSWYIIETGESFNGMRDPAEQPQKQGCFIQWFSSNAFGGTNYSSTPIGAVCNVEEPDEIGLNLPAPYFGGWAAGRIFSYCAWNSFPRVTYYLQVVGDPFTKQ